MRLIPFTNSHLPEITRWFPDARSCAIWGGPEFRYPFTEASFQDDMKLEFPSFSLINDADELLGFGQYYLRAERCHLARLVIAPQRRGRGAGAFLIRELCKLGCTALKTNECSLFVIETNTPALHLYSRLGFRPVPYPGEPPRLDGCLYLVASASQLIGKAPGSVWI